MVRKAFNAKDTVSLGPYSQSIDSGDFIFFSGQTAVNSAGVFRSVLCLSGVSKVLELFLLVERDCKLWNLE